MSRLGPQPGGFVFCAHGRLRSLGSQIVAKLANIPARDSGTEFSRGGNAAILDTPPNEWPEQAYSAWTTGTAHSRYREGNRNS